MILDIYGSCCRSLTSQPKWDIDELHRHPDFVPIKKAPAPAPPKQPMEDDDLPPRPLDVGKRPSNSNTPTFDGDGEFGSKCLGSTLELSNKTRRLV